MELTSPAYDPLNVIIHAQDVSRLTELLKEPRDTNVRRTASMMIIASNISAQVTQNSFALLPKFIYEFVLKELGSHKYNPYCRFHSPVDDIALSIQYTPFLLECMLKHRALHLNTTRS